MRCAAPAIHQRGSALFAALFLLIVVGMLGAYAIRLGVNQDQTNTLQLLQLRAAAAAYSGLEYASNRASAANSCLTTNFGPLTPGLNNFAVAVTCARITSGASGIEFVYELSATATSSAAYGTPDFVRRTLERRVTNIGPGTW